ncbi:MAG: hypothetical protein RL215_2726 [Planctomycetota bacterium]
MQRSGGGNLNELRAVGEGIRRQRQISSLVLNLQKESTSGVVGVR